MGGQYDQYIHHPPHLRLSMKDGGMVVFDGDFITQEQLGYPFMMGHQFVRKPFKGDNPCHTHNFHEVLAWYGTTVVGRVAKAGAAGTDGTERVRG
jgi:hypothetical protein